jgi:hypothetical protein
MTQEFDPRSSINPEYAEHNKNAQARKTMDGWIQVPKLGAGDAVEWKDAINVSVGASSVSLTLLKDKTYRLSCNVDCFIKMSNDGATAVSSANGMLFVHGQTLHVTTDTYHIVNVIKDSSNGFLSAIEILP